MPAIDAGRLIGDLRALREFGRCGSGVVRQSLTEVDLESRHWLVGRMTDAGLDASIDGIGTVFGRSRRGGKALLVGSHTDTQPTGGWLDGSLGVIYGLETVRALAECDETRDLAVDVASWTDEEGTFLGLTGSAVFCGLVEEAALDRASNASGETLRSALRRAGLEGRPVRRAETSRYAGYLEAHIEQGPFLEEQGRRVGVVSGIVGIRDHRIRFEGEQNHAGTTPMPRRRDAGRALVGFAARVHETFARHAGPRSVWTIGRIDLEPGAASIIPGRAWLTLQYRDSEAAQLDRFTELVRELVDEFDSRGPVRVVAEPRGEWVEPAVMDDGLQAHVRAAAERHAPGQWMTMPSAAGHDAQNIARLIPSAMLFVPSIGGVSHAFSEDTSEDDIALGCQVFADAAASILQGAMIDVQCGPGTCMMEIREIGT